MTDESSKDELDAALSRSVDFLREEVPVRAAWRDALIARIDVEPDVAAGAWRVRPALAVAAGLVLLVGGAAVGRFSTRERPAIVAASAANIRFVYVAPGATNVSVVGDFNGWNAQAMPLRRLGDGTWIVDVPLPPGRYAYAFLVDGRITVDPSAPRADGEFGENSVLMVRGL